MAVDCLILDVRMPGLSGPELRERLRSRPTPTPVVLVTGDTDTKARDIHPPLDAPLVTKPFDEVDADGGHRPRSLIGKGSAKRHAH